MNIYDVNGRVLAKSSEVAAYLANLIAIELKRRIHSVQIIKKIPGASGSIYYSGVWSESGKSVFMKLGVNENQRYWTEMIFRADPTLVPTLYASGKYLGGLKLGWMVTEKVEHGMESDRGGNEYSMMLDAAARLHRVTRGIPAQYIIRVDKDWVRKQLHRGLSYNPPGPAAAVLNRLDADYEWVAARCQFEVCHGDLHLANGVSGSIPPLFGNCLLIDLSQIIQPWAFDAAFLQMSSLARKTREGNRDLVYKLSQSREKYGLETCSQSDMKPLSTIVLAWFAIRQWGRNTAWHSDNAYRKEFQSYIENCVRL